MTSNPNIFKNAGFNISTFKSQVFENGLLKNNLYLVDFTTSKLGNLIGGGREKLFFYTSEVSLPSMEVATQEIRRFGYGPLEKVPYRPLFSDMKMTFYTDASSKSALVYALKYMTNNVVNFMNYRQNFEASSNNPYAVSYKDDMKFDLSVYIYNEKPNYILVYTFRDCFVREVDGANLSWETQDQLLKTAITFSYTDFYVETFTARTASNELINQASQLSTGGIWYSEDAQSRRSDDGLDTISSLQKILSLGSMAQTITALKTPQSVRDAINIANAVTLNLAGVGI